MTPPDRADAMAQDHAHRRDRERAGHQRDARDRRRVQCRWCSRPSNRRLFEHYAGLRRRSRHQGRRRVLRRLRGFQASPPRSARRPFARSARSAGRRTRRTNISRSTRWCRARRRWRWRWRGWGRARSARHPGRRATRADPELISPVRDGSRRARPSLCAKVGMTAQRRPTRLTGPPRFARVPGRTPAPGAPTPQPSGAERRDTTGSDAFSGRPDTEPSPSCERPIRTQVGRRATKVRLRAVNRRAGTPGKGRPWC